MGPGSPRIRHTRIEGCFPAHPGYPQGQGHFRHPMGISAPGAAAHTCPPAPSQGLTHWLRVRWSSGSLSRNSMMSRRLWTYLCRRGGGITLAQGQAPAHPTLLTQCLPCACRGQCRVGSMQWAAQVDKLHHKFPHSAPSVTPPDNTVNVLSKQTSDLLVLRGPLLCCPRRAVFEGAWWPPHPRGSW